MLSSGVQQEFTLHWRHLPSGKEGQRPHVIQAPCYSEAQREMLRLCNAWNRSSEWHYWCEGGGLDVSAEPKRY